MRKDVVLSIDLYGIKSGEKNYPGNMILTSCSVISECLISKTTLVFSQ